MLCDWCWRPPGTKEPSPALTGIVQQEKLLESLVLQSLHTWPCTTLAAQQQQQWNSQLLPDNNMHASHSRRCAGLSAAISAGVFTDETPTTMLMDLDQIDATITHVQQEAGYPESALHTVAVKANPVGKVLQVFRDRGMGAEVGGRPPHSTHQHC